MKLTITITAEERVAIVKAAREKGISQENYMKSCIFPGAGYGKIKLQRNKGLSWSIHKEAVKAKVKKEKANEHSV